LNLLGVDVGFAASSLTTGLAWRIGNRIGAIKTGTTWQSRRDSLPIGATFSIAALDAPILPVHEAEPHRGCESIFYGGTFWNRCRPGLSHYGRGLDLRKAGAQAASQFATVLSGTRLLRDLEVQRDSALIEAFPNAFLGVLLPEEVYEQCDRRPHEHKSDWMFRKAVERGILADLLAELGWSDARTSAQFLNQAGPDGDHDIRAALVCLLTAGFAALETAVVVGDANHGWFWLAPTKFWQQWASIALGRQIQKLKKGKFPSINVWTKEFFAPVKPPGVD
jgi:hypothetical protein